GAARALADDRTAQPEGLDGAETGRRPPRRGVLARAPGPDRRRAREPRAPAPARGVAAQLPPRGALRRERTARACAARARPGRRAADECDPPRERGPAAPRAAPARVPRLRRARRAARARDRREHAAARRDAARRPAPKPGQLPRLRPRRDHVEPALGGLRGERQDLARGPPARGRRRRGPRRRRARDGVALPAHAPGVARGVSPYPAPTPRR